MVLVVAVLVVLMIARRIYGEPLRARRLVMAPLAELAIGGYELVTHDGLPAGEWVSLAVTGAVSLALGAARGATLHLFERRGYLWQRYRPRTFAVWAGAFAARFGVRWLFAATGVAGGSAVSVEAIRAGHGMTPALVGTLLITSGLGFLGESLVLAPRATATGVPLMPAGTRGGGPLGGLLGELSDRRTVDGGRDRAWKLPPRR